MDTRFLLLCILLSYSVHAQLPSGFTLTATPTSTPTAQQLGQAATYREAALLDPRFYATYLLKETECPGTDPGDCKYLSTPKGDQDQLGFNWTCPAGFYCPSPPNQQEPQRCGPGFFCPLNSSQPIYCPAKYYCPTPSEIYRCSRNYYCPAGSDKQIACNFLAVCAEKTEYAPKFGIFVLFLLFCIVVLIGFKLKENHDRETQAGHRQRLEKLDDEVEEAFLDPLTKKFNISFEGLGLKLPNGMEIMKGVSGSFKSGRIAAIMGPSGAGKTTLVTVLMGKQKRTKGKVWVNNNEEELFKYKKLIGYVPQEDVMLRELTVYNILFHSAKMRLPADFTTDKIQKKVASVIKFLGLSGVVDSVIGDETVRGISGGQRKRVNIGMELVAEPSVLFLDEPTSGLDSSTAFEVCKMLKTAAQMQGLTVAAVIHSPSPSTFRQFDDLVLLGKGGQLVYFGPREAATAYFAKIGFPLPQDEAPADYFMNVVSGKIAREGDEFFEPSDLFEFWKEFEKVGHRLESFNVPKIARVRDVSLDLQQEEEEPFLNRNGTFTGTFTGEDEKLMAQPSSSSKPEPKINFTRTKKSMTAATKPKGTFFKSLGHAFLDMFATIWWYITDLFREWWETIKAIFYFLTCQKDPIRENVGAEMQLWLCFKRAAIQFYRTPGAIVFEMLLHLGCGTFISVAVQKMTSLGSLPLDVCITTPYVMRWRCWNPEDTLRQAGMFVALGTMFAGINVGSGTFGKEKVVYWRERATGLKTLPYFLGKAVVDLPRILFAAIMYSTALTLFFPYRQYFSDLYVSVLLLYFSAFAIGYTISIFFNNATVPLVGTAMSLLWALNCKPSQMPQSSGSGKISSPRYFIEAFWLNEMARRPWDDFQKIEDGKEARYAYIKGNFHKDLLFMVYIALGWNFLAFLALKLVNRRRQV
ncbi:hypothetical protein HK098_007403 [Nowakowskiella sp. JEL0407]|nr:hypothetical protein HK098_007403 [Nowakowskiella sp. JEL0407]